ncbi:MAG: hypothetical protein WBY94_04930, partial [Polyangiaceae bacterium]
MRRTRLFPLSVALGALLLAGPPARSAPEPAAPRWTDRTPDAMVEDAAARALAQETSEGART